MIESRWLWISTRLPLLCLITGISSVGLGGCGHADATADDPRTAPPLVRTAIVESAPPASVAYTGTVVARVESDLAFRVSGKVIARLVERGETVEHGQPLMRLDPDDLALAQNARRESVAAARARAQQAQEDLARYRDLRGSGAISESTYDRIQAAAESAQADLNAAQANAKVAGNAEGYAELIADRDGVIMNTMAEPGEVVTPGQVVIRIAQAGPREAKISLPETERPALGSTAQAMIYGQGDRAIATHLRLLSDAADPATRTYEARYVLDTQSLDAPLGATVTVNVAHAPDETQKHALQVPLLAIHDPGDGPGLWTVAPGKPATVHWKPVALLRVTDQNAIISADLALGQKIVALGADRLHPEAQVRVSTTGETDAEILGRE
ncbi:efflux RND transporter periplasmic adaptor subunit [Salinisphaera japonica]|uniref:Secretion protein HylD n=1 Tax=Salinisphaera japonica YTM-1 TaxID=1209778 RepID=A0A423Q123_9GAMM|nr:efflux RND transporter periplasmic adaptor subunit [Salinisphaera japonica]ROO31962.1 secretion protein HylD [Salinisphaera japonica YTM-1]